MFISHLIAMCVHTRTQYALLFGCYYLKANKIFLLYFVLVLDFRKEPVVKFTIVEIEFVITTVIMR